MAVNQFGLLKRIIAVDLAIGSLDYQDVHVLINPEIIWHSENQILGSEGCKSIPYVYGFVKRYEEVHVKAFDRSGNILQICSNGRPAALLQHEIEHLNGRLFIDYLENPTMAFFVKNKDIDKYRENPVLWAEFISVAKLVKK